MGGPLQKHNASVPFLIIFSQRNGIYILEQHVDVVIPFLSKSV
jgi:hypothetical protein